MRKPVYLLLLLTAVLLTGCVEYSDRIVIEADGSGVYFLQMGINEMFLDEDDDFEAEMLDQSKAPAGFVFIEGRAYHDSGTQWVDVEYATENFSTLPETTTDDFPFVGRIEWYEQNGYWIYRRHLDFADDLGSNFGDAQGDEFARMLLASFQWEYTVQFPGEIVEANTGEHRINRSEDTVTWSFSLTALSSGSRVMTAKIRMPDLAAAIDDEPDDEIAGVAEADPWVVDRAEDDWWVYTGRSVEDLRQLLEAGAPLDDRDRYGRTPLMYFAENQGQLAVIELLLEYGADVQARSRNGYSVLMHALNGQATVDVLESLLSVGAPVNARTEDGRSALTMALRLDVSADGIERLLQYGADPNAEEVEGLTPLLLAASRSSDPAVITSLLNAGADLAARTSQGLDAPILAASLNTEPAVLALLLERSGDLDQLHAKGMPLIMWSVLNTNSEVVLVALNAGANVNQRLGDGITVLMKAAQESVNPEVIDVLLANGADGSLTDNHGRTAFDHAQNNPNLIGTDEYWRLNDSRF